MAFVGEAVVSTLIGTLFNKLSSSDLLQFARREEVVANIREWEKTMRKLRSVLVDAEKQQLTSERVKIWLDDLADLVYDVEDILDEFAIEAFMAETTTTPQPIAQVRTFHIPSCCASVSFHPSAIKFNVKMRSKLDGITSRFQQISAQMNDLHLVDTILSGAGRTATTTTRPVIPAETTCIVDESRVCGRELDKAAILELLLLDHHDQYCDCEPSDDDDAVRVIAITGMGGLGKTTLAQLVYNHDKVQTHFDLKVWVCVSDNFDVTRLTKTILQSVASLEPEVNDLNQLQLKLKDQLSGKKFLLVLDDVWNENRRTWENFYLPLMKSGAQGSRVIVTTRNQGVVEAVGATTSTTYPLKELSNYEFLSLLAQQALSARDFDNHPDLRDIAEQIARKCKGLPLAAKAMGGMLQRNQNPDAWEEILKSKIWDLPNQENNDILPALKLSYHHLPSHLKRCFAYCSIFPKDYEFEVNELVLLWMGEGFLDNVNGPRQMEEIGTEFFRELLARSFFQQSDHKSSHFVMHDLIHDLAQFVAGDTCFNLEDKLENNVQHTISKRARHSSFIRQGYEMAGKFKAFGNEVKTNLRTLISLPTTIQYGWKRGYISHKMLCDLLMGIRCLRVLSLAGYYIKEVPDVIGNLKHLRYLNFSDCSSIERLPNSVGDLYNLQMLILHDCAKLVALPKGIGKLTNLRHLDISGTSELLEMSFQVANLTNLRTLSRFVISKSGGLGIEELRNITDLQGVLAISNLEEIVNVGDASDANLRNKRKLEGLVMEWRDGKWDSRKSTADHELQVLESLRPHENLKRLEVAFYGGWKFPRWIVDTCFTKMVSLTLRGCRNCTALPTIGALPSLEVLKIKGMGKVESIGVEFYGGESCLNPFASLKELRFEDMAGWESWSYSSSASSSLMLQKNSNKRGAIMLFPKLERLEISECPKLKEGLPKCMESPELGGGLASPHELLSEGRGRVEEGGVFILFSNLKFLSIEKCDHLEELPLPNGRLHSLQELIIMGCPKLESFPDTTGGLPPMLRRLEVENCQRLKGLPLHNSSSSSSCVLESLKIENCPSLRCFHTPPPSSNSSSGLPSTLKVLSIDNCENLESLLPLMIIECKNNSSTTSTSSLESLTISHCRSLKSFPRELPSTLKKLFIWDCSNLEAMPKKVFANNTSNIETVWLWGYPNLRILPLLPERIKELWIGGCEGLECCFLTTTGSLSTSWPCNLTRLEIHGCRQLKSLPHQMKDLNSLTYLSIYQCPGLESFPQGGLAPNLTSLIVGRCKNLKTPLAEWGIQSLSSLSILSIDGIFPDMVSFPVDDSLFPSSLTSLTISGMPSLISFSLPNLPSLTSLDVSNMKSLASLPLPRLPSLTSLTITCMESLASLPLPRLPSLTSLKITSMESLASLPLPRLPSLTSLQIRRMESLASLPLQNLTSLQTLDISDCPKLRSLGSLLPATLESLDIRNCPIIRKRFLKRKGEYFPNIAYIPCIRIDGELIHTLLKYNEQKWKCIL